MVEYIMLVHETRINTYYKIATSTYREYCYQVPKVQKEVIISPIDLEIKYIKKVSLLPKFNR